MAQFEYDLNDKDYTLVASEIDTALGDKDYIRIITSKNLDYDTKEFIKKFFNAKVTSLSSSIKFCKLAEGKADIYPRLQSINKWDIAAGDAILRAAGGILINSQGKFFDYSTASSKTGKFFALSTISILDIIK